MPLIDNNNNNNNNNIKTILNDDETTNCIQVILTRSPLHGFGIAISGGNNENKSNDIKRNNKSYYDENQFDNQSLIVCEVIKNGPADGKILPNDQIISVNGHPVVRYMEHSALKLIRESTDFVNLIVRRRKHPVIVSDSEPPVKCTLNKTRKDDKFGVILGCRYFIKKIHYTNSDLFTNLHEGDEVIKINETPVDRLTLPEAQKLIDKAKERLVLFVIPNKLTNDKSSSSSSSYPIENGISNHQESTSIPIAVNNRPSSSRKELQSDYNQHIFERPTINRHDFMRTNTGTRYVSFFTDTSSMGIRLAGGDKHGLFICEVQSNSVAHKAGLLVADKIFSVNNIDFSTLSREEAVLCLMNMKTLQVNMIVANLRHEYEQLLADVGGDSFYIRAHFTYNTTNEEELSIRVNDILHVTDTLYNGQVGYWVATKLNAPPSLNKITGAIPNKSRAEQLASIAPSLDQLIKSKQPSFKRKLRSKFSDKRSRSVSSIHHLKEDSLFAKVVCWKPLTNSKFPAYERVVLKAVTIVRPVVLFGPLADIARDRLLKEYPDRFELPRIEMHSPTKARANVIKLQSIKNVIQRNRHCLLDVTPTAVEQLNYAQCSPIVIYFKAADRRQIKQIRHEYGKLYQKSSRRLFDSSERLEFLYSYLFTSVIKLDTSMNWYKTLKGQIEMQQEQPIWISDDRPADKDLPNSDEYFISTRQSYSDDNCTRDESSPDSEMMNTHQGKGKNYLQRVASDPVMFPRDKTRSYSTDLHRDLDDDDEEEEEEEEEEDDNSTFMQDSTMSLPNRSHSVMEIPTTNGDQNHHRTALLHSNSATNSSLLYQRSLSHIKTINDNNNNIEPPSVNGDDSFRTDKYNIDRNSSINARLYHSTTNGHPVYRTDSISHAEQDDIYRLQRLYHHDEQEKYKNRFENEQLSNSQSTAKLIPPPLIKTHAHEINGSSNGNIHRIPSRRPLIAPKLRTININERLSSSDSGGSIQHNNRKNTSNDKSTMTNTDKNLSQNGYSTWNKSTPSRPTILPSYSNGVDPYVNNIDPSYRIIRCTSMDTVRRNEQIPTVDSNEKLRTELLLKQKMCSSKKHNHTQVGTILPPENSRSQSFSTTAANNLNYQSSTNRHPYQNGEFPLQKPRVYTHDDRLYAVQQQQNILSSSSTSSTLSVKDKSIKDVGETRSYTMQDGSDVIGSARGVMDYYGGKLSCPLTGVSISVPVGAIPEGVQQEIYFQVCQNGSNIPTFNAKQGERLLSPIVMCGPHGVQFLKPVELILPHCAGTDAQQLALMLHGANQNGSTNHPHDKSMLSNGINHVTNSNVSILVDHF